jgi:hypothetical protein
MISLRVTEEDDRLLGELARALDLPGGKADVLRKALDYWLENAPEARQAGRPKGREEKKG